MGNLLNKQIDQSYQGLIKTNDEAAIGATEKRLQDGTGQDLPVEVGTGGMTYYGTQDFTNATVTGIGGGGASFGTSVRYYATGGYAGAAVGPYTFFTNTSVFYPVWMDQGQTLDEMVIEVTQAFTTTALEVAIYDSILYNGSRVSNGWITPGTQLTQVGSIDGTTVGFKNITGLAFNTPYTGIYWLAIYVPGVWDGALGSMSSTVNAFNSYTRSYQYLNLLVPGLENPTRALRAGAFQASYSDTFSWLTTSGYAFIGINS